MKFIVYRNTDGAIMRNGECPDDDLPLQALTGETVIEGEADGSIEYISGGVVTARPEVTAAWNKTTIDADGIDTATFGSTLPDPTSVIVIVPTGAAIPDEETVTGGTFSFATPVAGEYTLSITPPLPYRPISQVITAV